MSKQDIVAFAHTTKLIHDGDLDDNRLHTPEMITTKSLDMSKREYQAMQKDLNKFEIKGPGFVVYAWNDVSGYDYWTVTMKEDNYIQITCSITNVSKADPKRIREAIDKAESHFAQYGRYT